MTLSDGVVQLQVKYANLPFLQSIRIGIETREYTTYKRAEI